MSLKTRVQQVRSWLQTPAGRRTQRYGRLLFVSGVVGWLLYRLTQIGWRDVYEGLPRTPWFYVLWLGLYFLLPATEAFIYRTLWKIRWRRVFPVLVRKRVLNTDVLGYSGEVYLYLWARRHTDRPDGHLLRTIKDNTILSSVASTVAVVLLVAGAVLSGQFALVDLLGQAADPVYIAAGGLAFGVLGALAVRFRRAIFYVPGRTAAVLLGVHVLRFFAMYALQVLQWWVVLPEAPLRVWATILVVGTVTNRIPFLPATDLLALGAVLGMTHLLEASAAVLAGMLVVRSVLDRTANAVLFVLTSWLERRRPTVPVTPVPSVDAEQPLTTPTE
ncbi:hypothetical protein Rhom172_2759 [Rhodothermus marinus SG0.5JP17-172]|uniref:hypothetical protein n=1 Tax=Rhodothermus marinus TaxID=29549 RepID=UPI000223DEE7|nr:hypothetical protein [Rhodothermus marinus]AEN74643.1 hypothetical protein Rhom172_2759 [Rhodothermus marinus SG0.5JP17-172]